MYINGKLIKAKLFSLLKLLKNPLHLIVLAFFHTSPISSELIYDGYNKNGDLLLYFNAQRSFHPGEISFHIGGKNLKNGIHLYVVLVVWDCEKRVDDIYSWVDNIFSPNKKARSLRECKEDTESMRQGLYALQGISTEHSRVKRRLDELKNELKIQVNHYRNAKEDQKQEHQMGKNLRGLKTAMMNLLNNQSRFDDSLQKIRNYLSQNQVDKIDQWVHLIQTLNEHNEGNNEIFERILSKLKLFQPTTAENRNKILNALNSFFTEDPNDFLNLSDEDQIKISSLQDDFFEVYRTMDQVIDLEYLIQQSIENWTLDDIQSDFSDLEKNMRRWAATSHTLQKQRYYYIMEYSLEFFSESKMIEIPNEINELISGNSEPELHQIEQLVDFIQSKESSNYISSYLNNLYSSYASSYFRFNYSYNSPPLDDDKDEIFHVHRFQDFLSIIKKLLIDGSQASVQGIQEFILDIDYNEPHLINIINNMELRLKLLSKQNIHNRINRSIDEVIELFAQMQVKVNENYKKSSSYKLSKIIDAMIEHHQNRSSLLDRRAMQLDYKITDLKGEIKNKQKELLEAWGIEDKTQLDFTESIPAFSFSFMLHPLPVWLLSDEQIKWMRRQDAFIRSWNRMREAGRGAYGR